MYNGIKIPESMIWKITGIRYYSGFWKLGSKIYCVLVQSLHLFENKVL